MPLIRFASPLTESIFFPHSLKQGNWEEGQAGQGLHCALPLAHQSARVKRFLRAIMLSPLPCLLRRRFSFSPPSRFFNNISLLLPLQMKSPSLETFPETPRFFSPLLQGFLSLYFKLPFLKIAKHRAPKRLAAGPPGKEESAYPLLRARAHLGDHLQKDCGAPPATCPAGIPRFPPPGGSHLGHGLSLRPL